MKPSDFDIRPWASALQNSQCELIAHNIMKILKRTGNVFRALTWEEYKSERLKDINFSDREKEYFDKVIGYCKSEETARLFSKSWEEVKC